ncbi:MAG: primosomal protein N' [Marinilabiliales bacterium]|nr:MAG: primosomal protein N' [Marinilabiliales bacterium]
MERKTLFADILLPLPVKGTFTYRIPYGLNEFVEEGQRVAVQFGRKKIYSGLIKKLHTNVPDYTPKYILHLIDEKAVTIQIQFEFWNWMSSYYLCAEGEIMNAALPSSLKLASESNVVLSPSFVADNDYLDEHEFKLTEALLKKKKLAVGEISKVVGFQNVLPLVKKMIDKNYLFMEEELKDGFKQRKEKFISLNTVYFDDEDLMKDLLDGLSTRSYKQLELLMFFLQISSFPANRDFQIKKDELLKKSNKSSAIINALINKEVFCVENKVVSRLEFKAGKKFVDDIILSNHQEEALDKIEGDLKSKDVVLLHGVTSSGKTEIYIKLIQKTLEQGKQVLYLLPEIALTTHIIQRLQQYFGKRIGVYHSRYNPNERAEIWRNIIGLDEDDNSEKYDIILGPRSAMFLPYSNLGLIIVDEEHDSSYKQFDPAPRYNARDASIYLAILHKAKVVLGSATPSIESYYNAMNGKYGYAKLTERYGGIEMPEIAVVDMKGEYKRKTIKSNFSSVLLKKISKALAEKKQVILFQNRRGFSLRIECRQCNWIPQCKNCDVTLTYHKNSELLKCHYFGYSTSIPATCNDCGSNDLKMMGFGTEKVEEDLEMIFPDAKITRMDLDSTRKKNAFQKIISDFEERKTDILTGTQMVTKGLDFDNVNVVGVLSTDNMLSFPDFRAHETSYQLMAQVSGRAGRKGRRGQVVLQSWNPDHHIIKNVVFNDYNSMYANQLKEREKFRYPPFYRLINIKIKHKDFKILNKGADVFANILKARFGKLVYGPEFPMVGRIRLYYIKQIMLKLPKNKSQTEMKKILLECLDEYRKLAAYKSVLIQFDVDPQ